jgi:NAD(P)-dependent dehydrogenase (short-subunit alcohol dehydrogenase family)
MTWSESLDGRVALVTGGAERVGAVIAQALGAVGADVAVNHLGQTGAAAKVVGAIERGGRRAVALEADVSSPAQGRELVDRTVRELGRLDLLIHNASSFVDRPFLQLTEEDFERSFGVIVRGPFFLSQAAARVMIAQGGGKIIAMLGNSLYEAWPDYVSHTVAKTALARLMEVLAVALSPHVQCLGLAPDRILDTDGSAGDNEALRGGRGEVASDGVVVLPGGQRFRTGNAEEAAAAVVELCRSSAYLNGAIIPLDGGKSRY